MGKFTATTAGAIKDKQATRGLVVVPEVMLRSMLACLDTKLAPWPRYFEYTTDGGNTVYAERVMVRDGIYSFYFIQKDYD